MTKHEILPCPFCGGEAHLSTVGRSWYRITAEHTEGCILEEHESDCPQTDDQLPLLLRDWNARASLPTLIQTLRDNGDLIAAQATIANQAQMIEHLRGGSIPCYTTTDVANADADGFKNGRKSVGLLLGKGFNTLEQAGGKYSIKLAFENADDAYAAFTEIATVVRLSKESGHG
jgi:hypothetical protein